MIIVTIFIHSKKEGHLGCHTLWKIFKLFLSPNSELYRNYLNSAKSNSLKFNLFLKKFIEFLLIYIMLQSLLLYYASVCGRTVSCITSSINKGERTSGVREDAQNFKF